MDNDTKQHSGTYNPQREQAKDIAIKSLAALGLIALLAIGTWGTFQVIRKSPEIVGGLSASVSNLKERIFPASTPEITINLSTKTVTSGEPFALMWQKEGTASNYSIVYECARELTFIAQTETFGETKRIGCNDPFTFSTATTSIMLTPLSLSERFVDTTIKLSALSGERTVAQDSVLITIVNETIAKGEPEIPSNPPEAPSRPSPTQYVPEYTTVTVPVYSDPNGFIDLEVEIVGVGVVENNVFTRKSELDRREDGAVKFIVRNVGTKASQLWDFSVELPTTPRYTYKSRNEQQALAPGERIEYTLGFDRIARKDTGEIVIEIDTEDSSGDINSRNNTASVQFEIQQ